MCILDDGPSERQTPKMSNTHEGLCAEPTRLTPEEVVFRLRRKVGVLTLKNFTGAFHPRLKVNFTRLSCLKINIVLCTDYT